MPPHPDDTLIVLPTFNEAANLAGVLERVHATVPHVQVLVVDDSSPDGTGRLADQLASSRGWLHVLHRASKDGLGAAYLAGFDWALSRGFAVIGEMDADGSHQPEQIPLLLSALDHADLVIGSRWVPGGSIVNWPRRREWLSRGGNLYTRLLLGVQIRDMTAGFRFFRRSALERIGLDQVESLGYVFQADLAYRAVSAGLRVVEVPIEFVERIRGESKMTPEVARESLLRITRWGLSRRLGAARKQSRTRGR